ncbi:MAG: pyruvate dehydrogenase complex dihydrolipoamide acetyltransferase [Flavobacteriia bacterium]|nr:pyruvate dehydrogenase complex dihydrolipoamide acetyltransferase [Flavobacteriia bacterium]
MAEVVYMPKLSDTMTEGVVAEWNKKVGDKVKSGEVLAEIETDKATMEFESFYDGTLLHIGIEKGKSAPVNSILAIIGNEGEDISTLITTKPTIVEVEKNQKPDVKVENKSESNTLIKETKNIENKHTITSNNDRTIASPLAKRLADEKGIDIHQVLGTGDGGRIVKRDIEHYTPYFPAYSNVSVSSFSESFTDENISQMRKTIARRLAESKFTAPHFYLKLKVEMDAVIDARKKINEKGTVKVSINDFIVKACANALVKHPTVNSSWLGEVIRRNHHVHVGVAVAVEDGLLVPVVKFANQKGLIEIGEEVREFAKKAKDKKLQPSDWEGNTFTISNLGMFGIDSFTAIINPPDSCILAVGGVNELPIVKNGEIKVANVMELTLSCDHRVVDGASGAAFLNTLKEFLENPVSMLL